MNMYLRVKDIRSYFINQLKKGYFTTDKTGVKTIELIGASFIADEEAIFGKPNEEYIAREIEWYERMSTNINDIYGEEREPPAAWKYAASNSGEINSNYGRLIHHPLYHKQFRHAVVELISQEGTRRATMVYNRPSIWDEYNKGGMSDFICTNAVTYYIRDNALQAVVQMRSNDVVFGYKNDYAWQRYVMNEVVEDHNFYCDNEKDHIKMGNLFWQVQNLHCYEKHFYLIDENHD